MRTEATFRTGTPKTDMTREEVVTWLLGNSGPVSLGAGMLASYGVTLLVDRLQAHPEGAICVELRGGQRWQVTVDRFGRWYNRRYTFHAQRLA